MKSVLVTGATTPFGAELVDALAGDRACGLVLAVGAEPALTTRWAGSRQVRYIQANLTRGREIRNLLFGPARELEVEAIVHAAQHRSPARTGRRAHRLNVEATRHLLHLAQRHPTVRRFVFRSYAEVYRARADQPSVIDEAHPLRLGDPAPQWLRDRVEADLMVCTSMGMSPLQITVLRCAEILAPGVGSQLHDYLRSKVCFRPLGYDPMLNLLTANDAVRAVQAALHWDGQGIFNIPGRDTLPLSETIRRWGRVEIQVPGPLLGPLYRLRRLALGTDFRYDLNLWRFHFSAVLDGRRARAALGYAPEQGIPWPVGGALPRDDRPRPKLRSIG